MTFQQIKNAALDLPESSRADLAQSLLQLILHRALKRNRFPVPLFVVALICALGGSFAAATHGATALPQPAPCPPLTIDPPLPGDFFRKPLPTDLDFLVYQVRFSGGPTVLISATILGQVEAILLANAYDPTTTVTMDVTDVLLVDPIGDYAGQGGPTRLLYDVRTAAGNLGWNYENYDYEVVVSEKFQVANAFNKNFRVSFVNGLTPDLEHLLIHEIGHGFKFEHADYWMGDPTVLSPGTQKHKEDFFAPMGQAVGNPNTNPIKHFHPRHKLWAGWLDDTEVPIVTQNQQYRIHKIEERTTLPGEYMGIRIRRDAQWTYYVFYRAEDAVADAQCLGESCNGAIITRAREINLRPSGDTVLLNPGTQPGEPTWENSVLGRNQIFDDGQMSIEVLDVKPDWIDVSVEFPTGSQPPIDSLPVIDILRPKPGNVVSGNLTIEVTAYDPDAGTRLTHFSGIDHIVIRFPNAGGSPVEKTLTCPQRKWRNFDTTQLADGPQEFTVKAVSKNGAEKTIRFRLFVRNSYP